MIAKKISVNGFIRKNDAIARNREQLKQVIDTCGSFRFLLGDRNWQFQTFLTHTSPVDSDLYWMNLHWALSKKYNQEILENF